MWSFKRKPTYFFWVQFFIYCKVCKTGYFLSLIYKREIILLTWLTLKTIFKIHIIYLKEKTAWLRLCPDPDPAKKTGSGSNWTKRPGSSTPAVQRPVRSLNMPIFLSNLVMAHWACEKIWSFAWRKKFIFETLPLKSTKKNWIWMLAV